jgi:antitoxin component HigA of HigAB toxin-antitoxin module
MTAAGAIKEKMLERNLSQADLVRMGVGTKSRVSELVSGKRAPSKAQALILSVKLRIPLRVLLMKAKENTANGTGSRDTSTTTR